MITHRIGPHSVLLPLQMRKINLFKAIKSTLINKNDLQKTWKLIKEFKSLKGIQSERN